MSKPGNDENVKSEKAGERGAGNDGAAEKKVNGPRADDGNAAGDGSANADAPEGVLIEAQDLAGEGHAESHEKKKHADDPGEFAGKFVGAEQKNLNHVDQNDGDHEVGAPAVERANVPAEGDGVIEGLQAVPGFSGGGNVDEGEQDAGDDLQNEDGKGGAAENVEPAGGLARYGMLDGFANGFRELQTLVEPVGNVLDQAHGDFPEILTSAVGLPGVGNSPALMRRLLPSIL